MGNRTYTTYTEAIQREIIDVIKGIDIEAIADEIIENKNGHWVAKHITPDEFWDIVSNNTWV